MIKSFRYYGKAIFNGKGRGYVVLILFLILMLMIHQYIFLYADDLYYSRDASYGLKYLPSFMVGQLNSNGRVWVHVLLAGLLSHNIYIFRIVNPIVLMTTAALLSKISLSLCNENNKYFLSVSASCLFFLVLMIDITHTTIYYAACALNYLYPTAAALLYGYMLYCYYMEEREKYKPRWYIILLSIFASSSTQQAGMIAIGFTILITVYFKAYLHKKIGKSIVVYYCLTLVGYSFVVYGSIKRMIFEQNSGKGANLTAALDGLLKTNIFSFPAASFVLLICLSSLFWLYYSNTSAAGVNRYMLAKRKLLSKGLQIGIIIYVYIVLYKKYNIKILFRSAGNSLLSAFIIGFTIIYLISIIYVSLLIAKKEKYPFILFCSVNAIGSSIMLLSVDSRFAEAYKTMFPSLLLMSIFIIYSFLKFYDNNLFLLLTVVMLVLPNINVLYHSENIKFLIAMFINGSSISSLIIILLLVLVTALIIYYRLLRESMMVLIVCIAFSIFGKTYYGYKRAAVEQDFNLNAINNYHISSDKSILVLRKIPNTIYGYNVSNWNSMPYFMKQCYKISEKTIIRYYK